MVCPATSIFGLQDSLTINVSRSKQWMSSFFVMGSTKRKDIYFKLIFPVDCGYST